MTRRPAPAIGLRHAGGAARPEGRSWRVLPRSWRVTFGATAAAVVGAVATAGAAWALWVAPSVTATAATSGGDPVEVVASPLTAMYPGSRAPLVLTIRNPASDAFRVTGIEFDPGGWPRACPRSLWTLNPPATLPTVPPGAARPVEVDVQLSSDAPDTCQGLSFSVRAVAQGARS